MDKNLKNSLLFGAAVGGIFTLLRGAGEKQKLTDLQLKGINDLNDTFIKVGKFVSEDLSLAPVYQGVKEFEPAKDYKGMIARIETDIQKDALNLGLVKSFKGKLQYVLSGRFTEQKNNTKAHQSQAIFAPLRELPDILESLLEKRTQILRLMQKAFRYIDAGEATDFKPGDASLLQSYVSQFKAFEKQAEGLLLEFK